MLERGKVGLNEQVHETCTYVFRGIPEFRAMVWLWVRVYHHEHEGPDLTALLSSNALEQNYHKRATLP